MFLIFVSSNNFLKEFIDFISPLTIICPTELSLAISHTPFLSNLLIRLSNVLMSDPKTAIIPPFPIGTAFCMALPLSSRRNNASLKLSEFEQTNAEYSPKE